MKFMRKFLSALTIPAFSIVVMCCIYFAIFLIALIFIITAFSFEGSKEHYYDKNKPTEFFKISEVWVDLGRRNKLEAFVLSNPPNDSASLRKIIEEYNLQTIHLDTIKKYSPYERVFYREDKCLNRNYEESKPYPEDFCAKFHGNDPGQQFGYHDELMKIAYYPYGSSFNYIYYIDVFGETYYNKFQIENIDQFFEEGRKKLNLDSTEN